MGRSGRQNFKWLLIFGLALAWSLPAVAADQITFMLKDGRNLRQGPQLTIKGAVPAGATVAIDPEFLKGHLGTPKPSAQRLKDFLLNPLSSPKGMRARRYFDSDVKRHLYDFFIPVRIVANDGSVVEGEMALPATFRSGKAKINIPDGYAPLRAEDRDSLAVSEGPKYSNETTTVAESCSTGCGATGEQGALGRATRDLKDVFAANSLQALRFIGDDLWEDYREFARGFSNQHGGGIDRGNAGRYKRLFVKSLVDKIGADKASRIIQALTAYGEAPHRADTETQIAELAAVARVVDNRGHNGFRADAKLITDIGLQGKVDRRMGAALAEWQFSVWNDSDESLVRLLKFHPDVTDPLTERRLLLSFVTIQKMAADQIEFRGSLADRRVRHYHANYVWPSWSRAKNKVANSVIRIKWAEGDYKDVNLNNQSGARHIFYAGLR